MAYRTSGNLAYDLSAYPEYTQRGSFDSQLRAMRTAREEKAARTSALLKTGAIMFAIILVVVAGLSFGRIVLLNSTVTTMIESDAISSQIAQARTVGTSLEMEQSVLANPSALKAQAKKLGMSTPYVVDNISLTPDVVAIDSAGSLSLSDTIKNVVDIQK